MIFKAPPPHSALGTQPVSRSKIPSVPPRRSATAALPKSVAQSPMDRKLFCDLNRNFTSGVLEAAQS